MSYKVSIIVPFFNAEKTIIRCVKSVLNQDFKNIELILVDNNSSDNTKNVLSEILDDRILLLNELNQGVSNARNTGILSATGDFIAFLDADDYWQSTYKLSRQVNKLSQDQSLSLCSTGAQYSDFDWGSIDLNNYILFDNYIITSSVMVRKKCLDLVPHPVFNPAVQFGEDWALWLKLSLVGGLCYISEKLTYYEIPSSSKYHTYKQCNGYAAAIQEAWLFGNQRHRFINKGTLDISLRLAMLKVFILPRLISALIYRAIRYAHKFRKI